MEKQLHQRVSLLQITSWEMKRGSILVLIFSIIQILVFSKDDGKLICQHGKVLPHKIDSTQSVSATPVNARITKDLLKYRLDSPTFDPSYSRLHRDEFNTNWIENYCPSTIDFFTEFRMFDFYDITGTLPLLTTSSALSSVCLLKVLSTVLQSIQCPWQLSEHATLAAVSHGGPTPWDSSSIGLLVDESCKEKFTKAITKPDLLLNQTISFYMQDIRDPTKQDVPLLPRYKGLFHHAKTHSSAMTKHDMGVVYAQPATSQTIPQSVVVIEFTKTTATVKDYFYAGYMFPGSLPSMHATTATSCVLLPPGKVSSSRITTATTAASSLQHIILDCCLLTPYFPFTTHQSLTTTHTNTNTTSTQPAIEVNGIQIPVSTKHTSPFVDIATRTNRLEHISPFVWTHWNTSLADRNAWRARTNVFSDAEYAQYWPYLNYIEVDNTISSSCPHAGRTKNWGTKKEKVTEKETKKETEKEEEQVLHILEFNAERGKTVAEFVASLHEMTQTIHQLHDDLSLPDATTTINTTLSSQMIDLIILNEMDIGMARSGNGHTTRTLAAALGMNYAYGIEFIELTNGDKEETEETVGQENLLGLHGNAILSRCPIQHPTMYRGMREDAYFNGKPSFVNANGYEKRLGSRMGMSILTTNSQSANAQHKESDWIFVSSIHKISHHDKSTLQAFNTTQRSYHNVYVGGDQAASFCALMGLQLVNHVDIPTWPANCDNSGKIRGDILCMKSPSNQVMKTKTTADTYLPCYQHPQTGKKKVLSDHAMLYFNILQSTEE